MLKPMLASDIPVDLKFPVMAALKYDGVRGSVQDGGFYARSLKPIKNRHIQSCASPLFNNLDGELCVGNVHEEATFRRSTSGIMAADGLPDFSFNVFDCMGMNAPFKERYEELEAWFDQSTLPGWIHLIEHIMIYNRPELDEMCANALAQGYEGIVVRDPNGKYKHGRSTKKEGGLGRYVPWEKEEAIVIGFEEGKHNTNEATVNELGKTNRSTNAENMVPSGRLGAFYVRNVKPPHIEFKIGNGKGLTHELCTDIWQNQDNYMSQIITYKHKVVGGYDKPRQAQFMGFRDPIDMGE